MSKYLHILKVLEGIKYIHSKNVLHRDIKPDNIFLGSEGKIKIGDFGISRKFETKKLHTQTMIGTPYYVSPELLME
jgi:serine/threonine protein kinase